ncbi:MAG: Gfo/Idh/MocA family oxidoreductase [Verrucomicrobia bacterium]|nr:Gfo/Idh/MocA family oxidoreductase [Verrucomicrobiota bacterium]MCG2681835.1 Gfo/Idh/MocA family oxidoreductase [Kiritimatiellia bacterium]MBU4247717.1 Gfo/Idh/MocA family oxidoreductase [Verrucomicrobiota bacterium]MBU4291632.1 Gfo/Idh/MocA family oxidoreductase [Verrucomicrobiota bacterium]MBU4429551.1 Gfo/Idh/MocA family oxidoreductase [Verrucomicrobiota bacterium]
MKRKRYVQVGLGGRSFMYTEAFVGTMKASCELVGLCDNNRGRMELRNQQIAELWKGKPVPVYSDRRFDAMIREQKPEVVVVTTKDCFHDKYIVRAMELGCDVITEKPMTIDAKKCQRIIDTAHKTGRTVRVTFNYRYSPPRTQVKDLLMKGIIGEVISVDFHWLLNTDHGADYFRRWHREKKNSGGLMVHKATHHFDLVNWWLSAQPVEVMAMGARRFYGSESGMAERYGLQGHAERCHGCRHGKKCHFFLNLEKNPNMKRGYLDCERYDGYFRDRCVFGKTMDIEDTMNLVVRYDSGAFMSYSLNAFVPWEGYKIAFNGTKGRLEHDCIESVYISGDGRVQGGTIPQGTRIRHYPHFKPVRDIPVWQSKGGHGGGDMPLIVNLFSPNPPRDPYLRAAGVADGALSILVGVAANKSMRIGRPVRIDQLVKNIPQVRRTPIKKW